MEQKIRRDRNMGDNLKKLRLEHNSSRPKTAKKPTKKIRLIQSESAMDIKKE